MDAVVLKHVPVAELPTAWRDRLGQASDTHVTIGIEAESGSIATHDASACAEDPMFGMWRDRKDMADVGRYVRRARAPRLNADDTAAPS